MRTVAGLLAVILCAGCGSEAKAPVGADAAELVPPDALVFVSVDADESGAWRTIYDLPAAGENYALLDLGADKPAVVALVRPTAEFPTLLRKDRRRYTTERIGGWKVAADSPAAFAAVRAAESGRSLRDVQAFQEAIAAVGKDAFATVYADGTRGAVRVLGFDGWVGAGLLAEDDVARLDVRADATVPIYRPRLLREVPSGALLAISFSNAQELVSRLAAEPSLGEYRALLVDLAPALRGEGILYVTQGILLPTIVLKVETARPDAAARALRSFATRLRAETNGVLSFKVAAREHRVLLTNGPLWPATAAGTLVDDQTFKDALAAADAPEEVSWLAYADLHRLAPIVQGLSQLLTGRPLDEEQRKRLDRLGTLVAFGARSGSNTRLVARITIR